MHTILQIDCNHFIIWYAPEICDVISSLENCFVLMLLNDEKYAKYFKRFALASEQCFWGVSVVCGRCYSNKSENNAMRYETLVNKWNDLIQFVTSNISACTWKDTRIRIKSLRRKRFRTWRVLHMRHYCQRYKIIVRLICNFNTNCFSMNDSLSAHQWFNSFTVFHISNTKK